MKIVAEKIIRPNCKYSLEIDDKVDLNGIKECGLYSSIEIKFVRYWWNEERKEIGQSTFSPLPGNSDIIVSHGLLIFSEYRGKGLAKIFQELRTFFAKSLKMSKIIATVNIENLPQVFSAKDAGWKFGSAFSSKQSGHKISLIEKDL